MSEFKTNKSARFLKLGFYSFTAIATLFLPRQADAIPFDPTVAQGTANFNYSLNSLDVNQQTEKVVIDWRSFNIDPNETTRFIQPSASSIALNRINDVNPTTIFGNLISNGNIILVNGNGILFGQGSSVDVGGMVATSANISNDAFMSSGPMVFDQAGSVNAKIINQGNITAKEGGLIGLVAPSVENEGVITARLGKVDIGSGDEFTLDFYGDGLMEVKLGDEAQHQLIKNTGTIEAAGGMVRISAAEGKNVVDSLIDIKGEIKTPAVSQHNGKIIIANASHTPLATRMAQNPNAVKRVNIAANISATGNSEVGGGEINIFGDDILVDSISLLDASSEIGGGEILIGGDFQGSGPNPTAVRTIIADGAQIKANATITGNGGKVIVWADDVTGFLGDIEAKGGSVSGDGGMAEVSGKNFLGFSGTVDLTAANGEKGTLLLDPTDITISTAADSNVTGVSPYSPSADDVTSNLNTTTLQNALSTASVTVQTRATGTQAGNITVSNAITWSAANTLTLSAANKIFINAAISAGAGSLTMVTNDLDIAANVSGTGALSISATTASTTIGLGASATGTMNITATELAFLVDGWSGITIGSTTGTGAIDVRAMTWSDNLTLQSNSGIITFNGAQSMGANNLTVTTSADLAISSTLSGTGTLTIQPVGNQTMRIGNTASDNIRLNTTEIANISNGWTDIVLGNTTNTSATTVDSAITWSDNLTLRTGTGVLTISAAQSMGANNLTLTVSSNLALTSTLSGTGTLTIQQVGNQTMRIGNTASDTIRLDTTEIGNISNGWSDIIFGNLTSTSAMTIDGAITWNDNVTFRTLSGVITVSAAQNVGSNNLTFIQASNTAIGANLTGTGTLTFAPNGNQTIRVGAAASNTIRLTTAETAFFVNGWSNIVIGSDTSTSTLVVDGAITWSDNLTLKSGTGIITISAAQAFGANNLTILNNANTSITANLTGTGTLTIAPPAATNTTIGLGGGAGTLAITAAEVAFFVNGWSSIVIGSSTNTSLITANALTWNDNLTFLTNTGGVTFGGAQSAGANTVNITASGAGNVSFATGTFTAGTLNISTAGGTVTQGAGLTVTDLSLAGAGATYTLTNTSNAITTLATNTTGTVSFLENSGYAIGTVNSIVGATANNLYLSSTGTVTQSQAINATGLSLAGAAGVYTLTNSSNAITTLSASVTTGTVNFREDSGYDIGTVNSVNGITATNAYLTSAAGTVTQSQALTVTSLLVGASSGSATFTLNNTSNAITTLASQGATTVNFTENSGYAIGTVNSVAGLTSTNAYLSTTGTVTQSAAITATDLLLSGTGGTYTLTTATNAITTLAANTGTVTYTDANNIDVGTVNSVVGITSTGNTTLLATLGDINVNQAIATGSGNLTMSAYDMSITANLTGTGTVNLVNIDNGRQMAVGSSATGGFALSDTELGKIIDGWTLVQFGSNNTATYTANIYLGNSGYTYNDNVKVITGGTISIDGAVNFGSNNLTMVANNLGINADMTGTGLLSYESLSDFGLGDGSTTSSWLANSELAHIVDGWTKLTFQADTSTFQVSSNRTWNDAMELIASGGFAVNGSMTMGSNNLTFTGNSMALGAALTGTGTLTIGQFDNTTTMALGDSQTGTLKLGDAELANITNGWNSLVFGRSTSNVSIDVGTLTFNDSVTFQSNHVKHLYGDLTFTGLSSVTFDGGWIDQVYDITTNGGSVTFSGTGENTNTSRANGTVVAFTGSNITTNNGNITFKDIMLNEITLNAGTGTIAFGGEVFADAAGAYDISATAANMTFNGMWGSSSTYGYDLPLGTVTLNATNSIALPAIRAANLYISNTGTVTQTGALTLTNLSLAGAGGVYTLTNSSNAITNLSANTGTVNFTENSGYTIGTVNSVAGITATNLYLDTTGANVSSSADIDVTNLLLQGEGGFSLFGTIDNIAANIGATGFAFIGTHGDSVIGTVNGVNGFTGSFLSWDQYSDGTISQTQAVNLTYLLLLNGFTTGAYTLNNSSNDIDFLASDTAGVISITDNSGFDIATINSTNGIVGTKSLFISSTGTVTQSQAINATNLSLAGAAGVYTLTNASNAITNLSANTGTVNFVENSGFAIGTVNSVAGLTATNAYLSSTGTVTQSAAITATNLSLAGAAGVYTLTNSSNNIGSVSANTGSINIDNGSNNIAVNTVNSVVGITASGSLTLVTTGNITLNQDVSAAGAGNSLVLASTIFTNNAGSNALTASGGRWLVYSNDPANNTLGGLTSDFTKYSSTYAGYPPGSVVESNNGLLYVVANTGTPITISGYAYTDFGSTLLTSGAVSILFDGTKYDVTTDGSGFYTYTYSLTGADVQVLAYLTGGTKGAHFQADIAANTSNFNIYGNYLITNADASSYSTTLADLATAQGAFSGANFFWTNAGSSIAMTNNYGLDIDSSVATLTIDSSLTTSGTGSVIINSTQAVNQSAAISAPNLSLTGAGGVYTLTNASNAITTLAANTGTVSFREDSGYAIGSVQGTTGLTATNAYLNSVGGTITQSQAITATNLSLAGAGGTYTLTNSSNNITTLSANTGAVTYRDSNSFTVGTVNSVNGTTTTGNTTLTATTGTLTTTQALATGSGNLTLNANSMALGANISGTGALAIATVTGTRNISLNYVTANTLDLTTAELNYIQDGWSGITFGAHTANIIYIGATTWLDAITFDSLSQNQIYGAISGNSNITFISTGGRTYVQDVSGAAVTSTGGNISFDSYESYLSGSAAIISTNGGTISFSDTIFFNSSNCDLTLNSNGGNITITNTDDYSGTGSAATFIANAGTGSISFDSIEGAFDLTATGSTLTFASAWGAATPLGTVTLNATNSIALPAITATNLYISDTGTVTQTGAITATNLSLAGAAGVYTLTNSSNAITTLSANTGTVNFREDSGFDIGTVNSVAGITATNAYLSSTGTVTQSAAINATNLSLAGVAGVYTLTNSSNAITTLSANTGTVNFREDSGFAIGTVNSVAGLTATNAYFSSTGTVTQSQAITATNLLLSGTSGTYTLSNASNAIDTLAGNAETITFKENSGYNIGTVNSVNGLTGGWNAAFFLSTLGTVTQSQSITGGGNSQMSLSGAGATWNLTNVNNDIRHFSANTGTVNFTDDTGFSVNFTADSVIGITATTVNFITTGTIDQVSYAPMTITNLSLSGAGGVYTFTSSNSNDFGTISANTGTVDIKDSNSFTVGSVNSINGITTTGNTTLTASTGTLTTTQAINVGSGNLTLNTNGIAIGAALTGTGTLTVAQIDNTTTMGLGDSSSGTLNLDSTEIAYITNGWANLVFGRSTSNVTMEIVGLTFNDNVTFKSNEGKTVYNDLTATGSSTVTFDGGWTEILSTITTAGGAVTFLGDGLDNSNFSGRTNGMLLALPGGGYHAEITTNNGNITLNEISLTDIILNAGSGTIAFGGKVYTDYTGPYDVTATAANMTFNGDWGSVSDGYGNALGTVTLNATNSIALPSIRATNLYISDTGTVTQTGAITATNLSLAGAAGVYTLTNSSNAITTLSANTGTVNFREDSGFDIGAVNSVNGVTATNAYFSSTGTVTQSQALTVTSLLLQGTGGVYTLTNSSNNISTLAANTGSINYADTNSFTVGTVNSVNGITTTGNTTLDAGTGTITTTQAIAVGSGNLSLTADDLVLGANLSGTGTLTIQPTTVSRNMTINYVTGGLDLTTAEIAYIQDGWTSLVFGRAATGSYTNRLYLGDVTFTDAVTFRQDIEYLDGVVTGSANLTFSADALFAEVGGAGITTSGSNVVINAIYAANADSTISTSGGSVSFTNTIQVDNSNLTVNTSNGNISVTGWITEDNNSAGKTLTFNAGTGTLSFADVIDGHYNLTTNSSSLTLGGAIGGTTALGTVNLTATNSIALPAITATNLYISDTGTVTQTGAITATNLSLAGAAGVYTLTNSSNAITTLSANTGTVEFTENSGFAIGTVNSVAGLTATNAYLSSTGTVTQSAAINATNLSLAGAAGVYTLTNSSNAITTLSANTGTVNFREDSGFDIGAVNSVNGVTATNAYFSSTGTVTQSQAINTTNLSLAGAAGVYTLTNSSNAITTLSANTGTVNFREDSGFDIGAVNSVNGVTATNAYFSSTGTVTQSQSIVATNALLSGAGTYTLTNSSNNIGTMAANAATINVNNGSNNISIGSVNSVVGATTTGTFTLATTGNITLDQDITSSAAGNAIVLSSTIFTNNAGSNALTASSGRWLVYSADPADDTTDGLTADFTRYSSTYVGYPPGSVVESGNGFLYALAGGILTFTVNDDSRVYGAANPTFSYTFSCSTGCTEGDATDGSISLSTVANGTSAVGTYDITAAIGTLTLTGAYSGYTINLVDGTLTVTQKALTITANNQNQTYGDGNSFTAGFSTSGLVNSETVGSVSYATNATSSTSGNWSAGSWDIVASAATGGTFNASNYSISYVNGTLSVAQKALTLDATGVNKVYDGTTAATVTFTDDRITNDVFTRNYTANFNNANVGTGKAVSVTGMSVTGTDAGNYALTSTTDSTTANITAASLTITANNQNQTYGDGNSFTAGFSTSGLVNSETVGSVSYATNATSSTSGNWSAGSWDIVASAATGGTFNASNYSISYVNGTLSVAQKALTLDATGVNKVYDGTTAATVTFTDDRITNDVFTRNYTANFNNANVGTGKAVSVTGMSVTGTDAGNYALTSTTDSTTANITAASLTITANNQNQTYGDGNSFTAGFSTSGLVNSETVGSVSYATNATSSTSGNWSAGSWDIVASAATGGTFNASNYSISYVNGTLSVAQKALTLDATGVNKVYDGTTAATVTFTDDRITNDVFTRNYTANFNNANVGTGKAVSVTGMSVTGTDAGNYALTSTTDSTTANITAASLTITANNQNQTYGDGNSFTAGFSTSGLVNSETVGSVSYATNATSSTSGNWSAGSWDIVASAATGGTFNASNYSISYVNGTLSVAQKALTLDATGVNKVYDGTTAATVTFTDDRITNDVFTRNYTANFNNANVGTGKAVSVTGMSVTGTDAGNYALTSTTDSTTANITAASLTITANNQNQTYGDGNSFTAGFSTSGLVNSETVGSVSYATNATSSTSGNWSAGSWDIVASAATGGTFNASNYSISYVNGTLSVAQKALTLDATGVNKVYDGTTAATVTFTDDRITNDVFTRNYTANFNNANVGTGKAVSVTGMSVTGTDAGNYALTSTTDSTTANITAASLTITANNQNQTYGDGNSFTAGFSTSGLVNSETVGSVSYATNATSSTSGNWSAGSWDIVASAATGGTFNASNYSISYVNGTLSVAQKALTLDATGVNKVYDGTTAATVTFTDDRITNDVFTRNYTANFNNANVGTGKAVSVTGMSVTGTDAGNYALTSTTDSTTANITAASLTITANNQNQTYGDGNSFTAGFSTSGLVNSETVGSVSYATNATSSTSGNWSAGSWDIVASAATGGTFNASNYSISYVNGTLSVAQKALTLDATGVNKVYDGTTAATVTFTDDRITNDVFTRNYTANFNNANVGTGKAVSVTGMSVTGTDAGNYALTSTTDSTTANITAASLTITANNQNQTYGDGNSFTAGFSTSGLVNSETVGSVSYATNATSSTSGNWSAGSWDIVASAATGGTFNASNYSISYVNGTLSVAQKALTLDATGVNKVYDGTTAATVTFTDDRITNDVFTRNYTANFNNANVGTGKAVSVTGMSVTGTDAGNYALTSTTDSTTANITAASLTITANNQNQTYGDGNSFTAGFSTSGLVNSETVGSVSYATNATSSTSGNWSAGSWDIVASAATGGTFNASNYSISYVNGTLSVAQKALTLDATGVNKVYDGTTAATVTFTDDRITNDVFTRNYTANFNNANVGTGKAVSVTGMSVTGTDAGNYALTSTTDSTTANITAASLTITANNQNQTYGDGNSFTAGFSTSGLVNSETVGSVSYATNATSSTSGNWSAGSWDIVASAATGGTFNASNYSISYVNGTLSVAQKALTLDATGVNKVYDGTTAATVTFTDDRITNDVFTRNYTANFNNANVGTGKAVSVTGMSVTGTDAGNYALTSTTDSTTANITAASLTITANNQNQTYGDGNSFTAGFSTSGLVNSETVGSVSYATNATSSTSGNWSAGSWDIVASAATGGTFNASNYSISYVNGTLSVAQKALTLDATGVNKVYDGTTAATVTFTDDRITNDVFTRNYTANFNNANVGTGKAVSVTGMSVTGTDAGNYALTSTTDSTTANITAASLTITANNQNQTYGDGNSFTAGFSTSGLVNSETVGSVSYATNATSSTSGNWSAGSWDIVASAATGGTFNASNYSISYVNGTLSVAQKALTLDATGVNKVYDGTTAATVTFTDDRITNDVFTRNYTANFNNANVGTGKAVSVTGMSVTGTDAGNYALTSTTDSTTANITAASLTITANNQNQTYGDGNSFTAGFSTSGLVNSETVGSVSYATNATSSTSGNWSAGSWNIVASAATGGTFNASNYSISYVNGTLSVAQKALTLDATGVNKVYDGTTAATVTFTDDRITNDVFTRNYTANFNNANVGTGKAVSVTGMSVTGTDAGNYALTSTTDSTTANITAASLTITANNQNQTYGDGNSFTAGFSTSGLVNSETVGSVSYATNATSSTSGNWSAGSWDIVASAATGGTFNASNYSISYVNGTLSVAQKALTLDATGVNKVYDGTTAATVTFTDDRITNDVFTRNYTANFNNANVGTGKAVSVTGMSVTGTDAGNYALTSTTDSTTANITAASLTITANNQNQTYGDGNSFTAGFSTSGLVNSETVGSVSYATNATSSTSGNWSAGSWNIVASAATGGTFNASNYSISYVNGTLSVAQKALTLDATGVNKVYDGTTAATVTFTDDRITNDVFTRNYTANFNNANVGTGKAVSVTGMSVTGTDAGNYALTSTTDSTTANITAASLTITANNQNQTYGDGNSFTAGFSTSGLVNSETVGSVSYATNATSSTSGNWSAGSWDIVASAATGGTFNASNYSISYVNGTLSVAQKALTLDATGVNKVYDGTTAATVTFTDDRITNDVFTRNYTANFNNANVGTGKAVSVTGMSVTGTDAGNYALTSTTDSTTANITAASLTITANNQNQTYGDGNSFTAGFSTSGLVNSETVGSVSYATNATSSTSGNWSAGSWDIVASAATGGTFNASNYSISYVNGTLSVAQKALTLDATGVNKVYDGTTAATVTFTDDRITNDVFTRNYTANFNNANVGTGKAVSVTGMSVTGTDAGNYALTSTTDSTTANITAASLTITANNQNQTYGDGNSFTAGFSTSGLVNSETVGSVSYATNATSSTSGNWSAGSWDIVASAATGGTFNASNYSISYVNGTLSVAQKALTLDATGVNKVYDGTTAATVTFTDDRITNDVFTRNYTANFNNANVGTGKAVSVTGMSVTGTDAGNYALTSTTDSTTANITAASLTITANNQNQTYGDGNSFTAGFSTSGLVNSETVGSVSYATNATSSTSGNWSAGSWDIVASAATGGTFNASNYSISYVNGTLSVAQKALTLDATGVNKVYDGTTAATVTFTDDRITNDVFTRNYTANFNNANVGTGKAVSVTGMSVTGTDAGNYALTSTTDSTTANITAASLTITANNQNQTYGDGNSFTAGFSTSGLVNSETVGSVSYATNATSSTSGNWSAGSWDIVASAATGGTFNASNYSISYVNGTLSVAKKDITGSINNASRVYGDANPSLNKNNVTWSGIVMGDSNADLDTVTISIAGTATSTANAGTTHAITLGSFSDDNYNLTSNTDGVLTINKRDITATVQNKNLTYGTATPTLNQSNAADVVWSNLANSETGAVLDTLTFTYGGATPGATNAVGNYILGISGFNDNNYNLTSTTTGTLAIAMMASSIIPNTVTATIPKINGKYSNGSRFSGTGLEPSGGKSCSKKKNDDSKDAKQNKDKDEQENCENSAI